MQANDLAKHMRDRALIIENDERFDETSLKHFAQVREEKQRKLQKLEAFKRMYFNAGRWVGGARDHTARMAFLEMKARER